MFYINALNAILFLALILTPTCSRSSVVSLLNESSLSSVHSDEGKFNAENNATTTSDAKEVETTNSTDGEQGIFEQINSSIDETSKFLERVVNNDTLPPPLPTCRGWKTKKMLIRKQLPCVIERFPFFVSIQDSYGSHLCAGTIVNKNIVITSGNCCDKVFNSNTTGRISAGMDLLGSEEQYARILRLKKHPTSDVCLIDTLDLFMPTLRTKFAKLHTRSELAKVNCNAGMVLGFGIHELHEKIKKTGKLTERLKCTPIELKLDDQSCKNSFSRKDSKYDDYGMQFEAESLHKKIVCGGLCQDKANACFLDEGGPYICDDNIFYGVVSKREICMTEATSKPILKLTDYEAWIRHAEVISFSSGWTFKTSFLFVFVIFLVYFAIMYKILY